MMVLILVFWATCFLAYSNGANDTFTHVSVGSLFGIGLITRETNIRVVSGILLSWVLTLPVAAILSGGVYWALNV